ncbi:MAG: tetratricopeptide (TPR) repeat protein [Candidatus Krumholzibacteriia bacterium]|jgi:tetratricopeptide (TPR) repeat protein
MTLVLAALLLVGLGVMLTKNDESGSISTSDEALRLYEEGTRDLNAFRFALALVKLEQSLDLDPTFAEAAIALTQAQMRTGNSDQGKITLARADSLVVDIDDSQRRQIAQLRLSPYSKSQFHSMRDSLLTLLQRSNPDNFHVLVAVASEAQGNDDDEAFEKAWLDIVANDPSYASSYNQLGYFELNRGNYKKAIEHMQKYSFLAPDLANPHDSLGEVLMVIGRYEEAELEFHLAVKMQPDFFASLINLGKIYIARGEVDRGVRVLEKVREQFAGSSFERQVDSSVALTYLIGGLDAEFLNVSEKFVSSFPDDGFSCTLRSVSLLKKNEIESALAVMDSTVLAMNDYDGEIDDDHRRGIDSATFQFKGLAADAVGDYSTSVSAWRETIEVNKERPKHHNGYLLLQLAQALYKTGQPKEALVWLDEMLAVNPRMINVLSLKVKCHLAMNDGLDARAALDQLQWSLTNADVDFPARKMAIDLETKVSAIAINN